MCKCNYAAIHWQPGLTVCMLTQMASNHWARTTLDRHAYVRHNYICITKEVVPAKIKTKTAKAKALLEEGTLNPRPGKVRDPKFQENEFFDPRDLVQVKYEMLRQVSVENASVTEATEKYGVSRPTYYQTKASFDKGGLAGLVPRDW